MRLISFTRVSLASLLHLFSSFRARLVSHYKFSPTFCSLLFPHQTPFPERLADCHSLVTARQSLYFASLIGSLHLKVQLFLRRDLTPDQYRRKPLENYHIVMSLIPALYFSCLICHLWKLILHYPDICNFNCKRVDPWLSAHY